MFSFLWVLTQSISTTSTGSFEEPSAYTRENNLRNAVCISKQGFNCAFQSRCYIFQIHFFFFVNRKRFALLLLPSHVF